MSVTSHGAGQSLSSNLPEHGVILKAVNDVSIVRGGNTVSATAGTKLESGDAVTTGTDSHAVVLMEDGRVEVVILENTEIRISSLWVKIGELFVRVKEGLRNRFEVESEYGVAGVEGTELLVRVQSRDAADSQYRCVTLRGEVDVWSPTGMWQPVALRRGEELVAHLGGTWQQRTLERGEIRALIERVHAIEPEFGPKVTVPDLVQGTKGDAIRILEDLGLTVGKVDPLVTAGVSLGAVLSQIPRAGEQVAPGSSVLLFVEGDYVAVPLLAGMTPVQAGEKLAQVGLKTGNVTTDCGRSQANSDGEVLVQKPVADDIVPIDSKVDLTILRDQCPPMPPILENVNVPR